MHVHTGMYCNSTLLADVSNGLRLREDRQTLPLGAVLTFFLWLLEWRAHGVCF
jgi:hypothetical protein